MSNTRIYLILCIALFCNYINAQKFVGGNINFNSTSQNEERNLTPPMKVRQSINNLNISPIIGKFTSEKVAIGVQLNIGFSGSNIKDGPQNKIFSLGASPFIRYYLYKWNKVSMFINGSVGTGFSNSKVTYADSTYDKPKLFSVYSEVVPGLSYDVNDHLILQTSLSYFGLNYNYSYSKDITGTRKESKFNIGGGLGYILSFNAITIGALYKF